VNYTPFITTKPSNCPTGPLTAQAQAWQMSYHEINADVTLAASGGVPTYSYSIVSNPSHGKLTLPLPHVTYQPETGFIGTDSFTYMVTDSVGTTATATVTFIIKDANIQVDSFDQEKPFVTNGNCTLGEAIVAANTDTAVDGCAAGNGFDVINL